MDAVKAAAKKDPRNLLRRKSSMIANLSPCQFPLYNQDTQVPYKPIILYRSAGEFGLALSWGFDLIGSRGCHVCAAVQIPRGLDSIDR